jgi:glycerate kinase
MKILIAPDKFKGSLTALDVCEITEDAIQKILPKAQITKIPLADGGEGSLDVIEKAINFDRIYFEVNNPLFRPIKTYYGLLGPVAYIEMAKASGLQLLSSPEQNPMRTSSFGTGELIVDAISKGAKVINLFVGGSSTNDAGLGMVSAIGYKFKDKNNRLIEPIGANLSQVTKIDNSKQISLENISLNILTDVTNPLFGINGAAHVFAKQKGATESEIIELDFGLMNFSKLIYSSFGIDVSQIPGSGAAGGIGAGAMAFCNAKILSGISFILDILNLNNNIAQSDFIITGEGKLDSQTLEGKVVHGVIKMCKKHSKPIGILCGENTLSNIELMKIEPVLIKSLINSEIEKEEAIKNAELYLRKRSEELIIDYLKYIK